MGETIEQDREAWELRCQHLTYAQIGEKLHLETSVAYRSAMRGCAMVPDETAVEGKKQALDMLDRTARHLLGVMARPHLRVDHGHVVMLGSEVLYDDGPGMQAAAQLIRVLERKAKMQGLDAPTVQRVEMITKDMIDAQIEALAAEMGVRDSAELERIMADAVAAASGDRSGEDGRLAGPPGSRRASQAGDEMGPP